MCLSVTEVYDAIYVMLQYHMQRCMMQYHKHWNAAIQIQWHFNTNHLLMFVCRQQDFTLTNWTAYLYLSYTETSKMYLELYYLC